jgi:tRNA(Ile)-lysidine synthase
MILLAKLKKTVQKYQMLSPGDTVLIAVSGGPDSVCLLAALHALSNELGISLHVAHLDHMFRGRESADEALFVANLAKRLGLPSTIESVDAAALCRERGLSVQAGAREARYAFLSRAAEMIGASRIATGHTATDQAETVLLRLLRGAGSAGLAGIPPVRGRFIRPLIETTREQVLEHLAQSRLAFVTDPSNTKPLYTRNRIRLELIPILKQFNPRIVEALAAEAALLKDEGEALDLIVETAYQAITEKRGDGFAVQREAFLALHRAIQRRLLRRLADALAHGPSGLSRVQVDEALQFMSAATTGRTMRLPAKLAIERSYERFLIGPSTAAAPFTYTLMVPGRTAIPECGIEVEAILCSSREAPPDTNYCWQALFDYDKISLPLQVRNRRPGDRFHPAGLGGKSKKLQDLLVDAKVPRQRRDTVPLLCSGTEILWVMGMRIDQRFRAQADTKQRLLVQVKNQGEGWKNQVEA